MHVVIDLAFFMFVVWAITAVLHKLEFMYYVRSGKRAAMRAWKRNGVISAHPKASPGKKA